MDRLEHLLLTAVIAVSQVLDPVVTGLKRLNFYMHNQMTFFNVPLSWHDGIIAIAWIVVLFMLFRLLTGWLRLAMLVCTALIVSKMWGYLPG